jgi:tetratricopeptide (TPR) repeat protein
MINLLSGMLLFGTSSFFTGFIRKGVAVSLSCLLFLFVLQMPNDLLKEIFLRDTSGKKPPEELIYLDEGLTTTVAVFDDDRGELKSTRLILNGVNMSGDTIKARKYMTLLSYVPLLLTENPKNVLVICFGTGLTAGAAGAYPELDLVDVVDISPGVFKAGKFFNSTNHNVINNPKVNKIIQDGRQHLLTTSTTYDVITAEPPPPMNAGSVNLYTREYYELTKRALNPGGIVSQWIPLHSQNETHIYQNFRTFLESFPYAMAWYPAHKELILIGSDQPINIDFQNIEQRLQDPVIKKIMSDIDFDTPYSFLGSIWFLKKELKRLGSGQLIISDNNPTLEYFISDADWESRFSLAGVYRIIDSRSSIEDVWEQITQSSYFLSKAQKDTFKKHGIIRIRDEYVEIYNDRGTALRIGGRISEAIAQYKKAVKLNPDSAKVHYNLGVALQDEGNTNEAIIHYKTTINLKPGYVKAHNNLGVALRQEGKNSEAISHYKMAVKLKPDHAQSHNNLGIALREEGKNSEAISHYKKAIELKPKFAQAHFNLGIALVAIGNTNKAIAHYKMAVKLKPEYYQAYYNLGNSLRNEGKNSEAISHYRRAIKLKPDYAKAHYNLGVALGREGKNSEAISHYKRAIELNPEHVHAHNNLGIALRKEGKDSEAIFHYKIAIELKPDFSDAYNNIGVVLFHTKKNEEAINYFKEAIRLEPDFDQAQRNLELALLRLEEHK